MHEIENDRRNVRSLHAQQKLCDETKKAGKRGKKRIEKVRETQNETRQKFIESSDFIRDCNAKTKQAKRRIDEEMQAQQILEHEISEFETKIKRITEFHDRFQSAIAEMQPYERMLDDVVSCMDLFESKDDLLNRCDALCMPNFNYVNFHKLDKLVN